MREILLSKGLKALVDDQDFEWLSQWRWCASASRPGMHYAKRTSNDKALYMHREIMRPPTGWTIDHVDGNTLNNQRCNLRLATQQMNQFNRPKRRDAIHCEYKGVTWTGRSWRIQLAGFHTQEDAHAAYLRASEVLHGEFGRRS